MTRELGRQLACGVTPITYDRLLPGTAPGSRCCGQPDSQLALRAAGETCEDPRPDLLELGGADMDNAMSGEDEGCVGNSDSSSSASRSAGRGANERGRRRREELLQAVVDYILDNGVVDFSLRQAAAATGTTHRMLLYHFGSTPELIGEALSVLRSRRVEQAVTAGAVLQGPGSLRESWEALMRDEPVARVLLQGIGLALAQPERYGTIGRESVEEYLPPIGAMLPSAWSVTRRNRSATVILAVIRGLMLDVFTTNDLTRVNEAIKLFEELITDAEWLEPG